MSRYIFFIYDALTIIIFDKQKFMFSKETLDKVKLAKQYIENRYQSMMNQEQKNLQNWNKIYTLVDPAIHDLQQIASSIVIQQNNYKRLYRQKDSLKNYKLFSVIGKGAFGQVRLAKNLYTNQVVAIKRLEKKYLIEKKQIYNAYLERDFMAKSHSQFIVEMKSTFQDQQYLYITMEYVQGGDLLHLLIEKDILTEDQTRFYIAQLVLAVEQIHKMNYIHRDIKPDNILIDKNGHLKISDFGLSKYLQYQSKRDNIKLTKIDRLKKLTHVKKQKIFTKVGTPDYISPQVLTDKTYSHSIDIWGIGVIMYQCLYGFPPFTDEDSKEVCLKVANWQQYLQFPMDVQVSNNAQMLILGLISHNSRRLTIKQIKRHPFFDGIDWQNIGKGPAPFIPNTRNEIDTSNFDEFQITKPWSQEQKQLYLEFLKPRSLSQKGPNVTKTYSHKDFQQDNIEIRKQNKQERKTVGPHFRFAGFDYRKLNLDPLEAATRQLVRNSVPVKTLKKKMMNKQISSKKVKNQLALKNIKNNRQLEKNRLSKGKKSTQKTRPSQVMSTTNNISFTLGRFSTSKQVLKTLGDENTGYSHENTIKKQKKSSSKNKLYKMKEIYCIGKARKTEQNQNKTHA